MDFLRFLLCLYARLSKSKLDSKQKDSPFQHDGLGVGKNLNNQTNIGSKLINNNINDISRCKMLQKGFDISVLSLFALFSIKLFYNALCVSPVGNAYIDSKSIEAKKYSNDK